MTQHEPNWVDRRAASERSLLQGAAGVWATIRAAMQDACNSYSQHYPQADARERVSVTPDGDNRLKVQRLITADFLSLRNPVELSVLVTFHASSCTITSRFELGSKEPRIDTFHIQADEHESFIVKQGRRMSADEISELVLHRILFPELKATAITPARPSAAKASAAI